jgi:hypothetical protein
VTLADFHTTQYIALFRANEEKSRQRAKDGGEWTGVERSLDTARKSARATSPSEHKPRWQSFAEYPSEGAFVAFGFSFQLGDELRIG